MEEILLILVMDEVIYRIDSWKMFGKDVYVIQRWVAPPPTYGIPLYE